MDTDGLRLVLVTRRFWPLVGGGERVMGGLAAALVGRRIPVTLLTARWEPQWPAEITYHGAPVIRLYNPSTRVWGTWRYMRALASWLRQHRGHYNLVYVSMLKHDAYAVLRVVGENVPVVLRAEGAGPTGDCQFHRQARLGMHIRRRTQKADALVAPSQPIQRELLEAGYPADRIAVIPNGVRIPTPRTPGAQLTARNALGAAVLALRVPHGAPVALFTGRLHEAKGLLELLAAWQRVVARWPSARLWLVGEGPLQGELERQIESRGLSGRVILAGVFDHVDELLMAADLYVLPSWEEGMSLALLEAMAAGLPIVASDIPGNRELLVEGQSGLLVPLGNPDRLSDAIERLILDKELGARLGAAARQAAESRFSLDRAVDEHLRLFRDLVEKRERGRTKAG